MNLNIRITWPAWAWINSTADILSSIFAKLWYDLITEIKYESRIKWWVNYFDVNISDLNEKFISKKVDILVCFNNKSLESQIPNLKENWTIIANSKNISPLLSQEKGLILQLEIADKYDNTYLLWILGKYLSIPKDILLEEIWEIFSKKWEEIVNQNKNIIEEIWENYKLPKKSEFEIKKIWEENQLIYGNKAVAKWAIAWWLEFYSAYPMTPASSILTEIINDWSIKYIQNEDEIAVIMSALWASYTWARAMTWTSGWWFALMTEALGFSVQAEIPITVVLSQRAWPSTWTPTYHEAADLNFALNPTFWDFEHIVLYPSNLEEAYYFAWLALNLADKYQTQVIYLIDKQASEMFWTISELKTPKIERWEMLENPPSDYKRYEITKNWISPRVKVWTKNGDFIASSYEHDEYWATTENPETKKAMTEKRTKKLNNFYEKEWFKWFEVINPNAKKMIIATSFTSYTAKKFVKDNPEFGLIIVKFLKPLDKRLKDEIIWKQEIIFVENNYSGQLEKYLTNEFSLNCVEWLKISHLRKYDLMPFYLEDFWEMK